MGKPRFVEMKLEEIKDLVSLLQNKGWSGIKVRTKIKESSGTFDIIAHSKGMLKKTMLVIISTDIYDAQIANMIFDGVPKKYLKMILLEEGDPFFVEHSDDIKILTNADNFPDA